MRADPEQATGHGTRCPLAEHFVTPKTPRRLASGRELVAQSKIFEPLQDEEESGPFPVGQTTEGREILPPTPTRLLLCFGRAHAVKKNSSCSGSQLKNVHLNSFLRLEALQLGAAAFRRARVSKKERKARKPGPRRLDIRTRVAKIVARSGIFEHS